MLITVDTGSGVPIYRQVLDQLRELILAGQLPAGDQLASVRDLAAGLNVNPMTISKAYSLLEHEGMLERRRGVGLFVRNLRTERRAQDTLAIIDEMLRSAAIKAVQFDVDCNTAESIFRTHYDRFRKKDGN